MNNDDIMQFEGPWDGPVVATSVHASHEVRAEIRSEMVLDEADRLREEDPHTDRIAGVVASRMVTLRSRFEVDLNRHRHEAVYREPDNCWGLDVWRGDVLTEDLAQGSLAVYDLVYAELGKRLDRLAERGPFVLLDVHSYNHRRGGADRQPSPESEKPEVNIGTRTVDRERFGPLVDAFSEELAAQTVQGHTLDVRQNVAFGGRAMPLFVNDGYPGVGCSLALEFKKTWMDEWTGEVDEVHLDELRAALAATLPVLEKSLAELG